MTSVSGWLRLRRRSRVGSVSCSGPLPPAPLPKPMPGRDKVGRTNAEHDGRRSAPAPRDSRRRARPPGSRCRNLRPSPGRARGSSAPCCSGPRRSGSPGSRPRCSRSSALRCRCPGRVPAPGTAWPAVRWPRPAGPAETSRSVIIMITPITVTKISFTPLSGSIGDAWVRMCSIPAAQRAAIVLEPRRRRAPGSERRPRPRAVRPARSRAGRRALRRRRAALVAVRCSTPPISDDQDPADSRGSWGPGSAAVTVRLASITRACDDGDGSLPVGGAHQAAVSSCSRADQASATPIPRVTSMTRHWLSRRIWPASSCWRSLPLAGRLVGEGVDVQQHRQALRPVAP